MAPRRGKRPPASPAVAGVTILKSTNPLADLQWITNFVSAGGTVFPNSPEAARLQNAFNALKDLGESGKLARMAVAAVRTIMMISKLDPEAGANRARGNARMAINSCRAFLRDLGVQPNPTAPETLETSEEV